GYSVIGLTMKLWEFDKSSPVPHGAKSCCDLGAIVDAGLVAQKLGIPHYVLDMTDEFKQLVVDDFLSNYQRGRTPNPCIRCNTFIKFDLLLARARNLGCQKLATGHYARIQETDNRPQLLRGTSAKDQSYALWGIGRDLLPKLAFPLGSLTKEKVRRAAREIGLPVAERDESQDVCFIPGEPIADFIERNLGESRPGDIIDSDGRVLGQHRGVSRFTVGQRRGLGLAAGEPLYVTAIEPETGQVQVGTAEKLMSDNLTAADINWVSVDPPTGPLSVSIQIRYRHRAAPGEIEPLADGRVAVRFHEPQRAVTPGQSAVFYDGDLLLGGGIIEDQSKG
ncbi:tRNA 2-thiouridine(34) synthase MnmA, partial [candidate division KSB1 bacterium]